VNAYNAVALSMNSDGFSDQQIADQLGTGRDEITQIIDAAKAGKTSVPQAPADPAGQAQSPATDPVPEVAELLAWAAGHEDQAVRTHGTQASAALTALRERRQADTELELITTEAARLEKRLADLRARESELRPATKKKQRDHDPREVRTWAREHQVPVPARGKIPDDVLAAWRQRSDGQTLALAS
jgi:hypothetical protein